MLRAWGLGLAEWGVSLRFRPWSLALRVQGSGFGAKGFAACGLGVWGLGQFRAQGLGFRVGIGFRVSWWFRVMTAEGHEGLNLEFTDLGSYSGR